MKMKDFFKLYEFKYGSNFFISNAAFNLMTQNNTSAALKDSQINTFVFKKVKLNFKNLKKLHLCYYITKNGVKICP